MRDFTLRINFSLFFLYSNIGRSSVNFIKQEVPKFIRDFKEKTNQTEPSPDINSKKRQKEDHYDEDEDIIKDDEVPLVSLAEGVTPEEAERYMKQSYGDKCKFEGKSTNANKRSYADERGIIKPMFFFMKVRPTYACCIDKRKSKVNMKSRVSLLHLIYLFFETDLTMQKLLPKFYFEITR